MDAQKFHTGTRAAAIIVLTVLAATTTAMEAPKTFAFRCPKLHSGKAGPSKQQDTMEEVVTALKCAQQQQDALQEIITALKNAQPKQGPSKPATSKKKPPKPKLISDERFAGCAIATEYRIPKVKVVTGSDNGCTMPKTKVVKTPSSWNGKTCVNEKYAQKSQPKPIAKPYGKPQHAPAKNKPLLKEFFQPVPPPAPTKQEVRKQKKEPQALQFTLKNLFGGYHAAEHGKNYIPLGSFLQRHYGLKYESLAEFLKSDGGRKAFEYAFGSATIYSGISKKDYVGGLLAEKTAGDTESPVFEKTTLGEQISHEFNIFVDKDFLLVSCGGGIHTWPIETLYLKKSEWA